MKSKTFYLKLFNLAGNLTEQQLHDLSANMIENQARKGQTVYAKGGEKKVLLLISGKVKISWISSSGDEMIKELVVPGDVFGDILPGYEDPNYEYAEVISARVIYYVIEQKQLDSLMRSNYILTMNYMAKLCEKLVGLENRYINMITKDVKSRLLYCFREWARKEGKRLGDKIVVKNSLTHRDLANLVSASRQTVTAILNKLKEAGEINYNRRKIEFSPQMFGNQI